ncbi:hypothetical protein HPB50_005886 [Hyalomma asiaticum]|uniref:Uncharacterized protein n=1 Tax=Hyalomma asiaticum TaxID=266040 RepID=A0ACB7SAP0_HYAAI|nr:hypothetical protein HPB50_005886 [Hyalomma asiaticum]
MFAGRAEEGAVAGRQSFAACVWASSERRRKVGHRRWETPLKKVTNIPVTRLTEFQDTHAGRTVVEGGSVVLTFPSLDPINQRPRDDTSAASYSWPVARTAPSSTKRNSVSVLPGPETPPFASFANERIGIEVLILPGLLCKEESAKVKGAAGPAGRQLGSLSTATPGLQSAARICGGESSSGIRRAAAWLRRAPGVAAPAENVSRLPDFLPSSPAAPRASLWLPPSFLPEAPFRQPPLYNKPVETSLCGWDSVRDERPRLGGRGDGGGEAVRYARALGIESGIARGESPTLSACEGSRSGDLGKLLEEEWIGLKAPGRKRSAADVTVKVLRLREFQVPKAAE